MTDLTPSVGSTCVLEQGGVCFLGVEEVLSAAYGKIIEVGFARELFDLRGRDVLMASVSLWEGGLPIETLPVDGMIEIPLGEENFAWATEKAAEKAPEPAPAEVQSSD